MNIIKAFWTEEEGLSAVEYIVAASALLGVIYAAFQTLGTKVTTKVGQINGL